jgi:hypothetical protein
MVEDCVKRTYLVYDSIGILSLQSQYDQHGLDLIEIARSDLGHQERQCSLRGRGYEENKDDNAPVEVLVSGSG